MNKPATFSITVGKVDIVLEQDWFVESMRSLEHYMDGLHESCYDAYDIDDLPEQDTLSGLPFCGCEVCTWREAMYWMAVMFAEAVHHGRVTWTVGE